MEWHPPLVSHPRAACTPSPLDSPPFPSADWIYGGAPTIGVPDTNVYPLMTALKRENSRTKIYGWVAPSFNYSTSANNNFPVSYDIFPNSVVLNQAVVYIERLPDTVQNSHFSFGFHLTASLETITASPPPRATSPSNCSCSTAATDSIPCWSTSISTSR